MNKILCLCLRKHGKGDYRNIFKMTYNCPQKEWLNNFSLKEEYTGTKVMVVLWQWTSEL